MSCAAFRKLSMRPVISFCVRMCGIVTVRLISIFGRQKSSVIETAVSGTPRIGYSTGAGAVAASAATATRSSIFIGRSTAALGDVFLFHAIDVELLRARDDLVERFAVVARLRPRSARVL